MIKKIIIPLVLFYASSIFSTKDEDEFLDISFVESTATHVKKHIFFEEMDNCPYIKTISYNLSNPQDLAGTLDEINKKLNDPKTANAIGAKALLFYYLIEEYLENNPEEKLETITIAQMQDFYNIACHVLQFSSQPHSLDGLILEFIDEFVEQSGLHEKIIISLNISLINAFFELDLIDQDTLKTLHIKTLECFNKFLIKTNISDEISKKIGQPLISHVFRKTPINYDELSQILIEEIENIPHEIQGKIYHYFHQLSDITDLRTLFKNS